MLVANGSMHASGYNDVESKGSDTNEDEQHTTNRQSVGAWIEDHMTWAWFTATQSTGGIAALLSECPKQFHGLQTIGTIIFIFNIILWLIFVGLMLIRWIRNPKAIRACLTKAPEAYFYGSFWLSTATFIICMQRFGEPNVGDWLTVVIRVLFWIYAAITLLNVTVHFAIVFQYAHIKSIEMNPAWFLMVFNAMLTGTVAAVIAETQPPQEVSISLPVINLLIADSVCRDCPSLSPVLDIKVLAC